MDDRELRVLLIENDPDDARRITENLVLGARSSWRAPAFTVTHVERLESGLARLDAAVSGDASPIDGVLVGPGLPDGPPDEILSTLHERFPHIARVALVPRGAAARPDGDAATGGQAILYEDEIQGSLLAHTMMHAIDQQAHTQALQAMAHRHQALFDQAHDAIFILDLEGRHVQANRRAAEMLGYSEDAMQRLSYRDVSAELAQSQEVIEQLLEGERIPLYERRFRTKDGATLPVEINVELVRDCEGRPQYIQSVVRDISARKRAEIQREAAIEAMQESQRRLEAVSRRLVHAQEIERRSLAHELHDEVGQVLAVVRLNLQALEAESQEESATAIRSCLDILDAAIAQMRNLSRDLRPSLLDNLGLVPALRSFIDQKAQQAPFDATFTASRLEGRLPERVENAYFRIVQEALTHVVPYAQAEHVAVDLRIEDETLVLTLQHDGTGFDIEEALVAVEGERSLGLATMRERTYLLGGAFAVISEPGAGTEIRVRTPIEPSKPGA